jgi:protein MAK16
MTSRRGFVSDARWSPQIIDNTFCRNKYNVSGLCNRQSCPLGNSRYATIREEEGKVYLYMKTIERAHTPALMWERVLLSRNYAKAMQTIDEQLAHWPKFLQFKCKQRLTRVHQYLVRMRKLKLKAQPKLVRIHKKSERRDMVREKKAEKAAKISTAIQKELLARLNDPEVDVYDGIYNFPRKEFKKLMDSEGVAQELDEGEMEEGEMDEEELEEEEDDEMVGQKELLVDEFVEADSDEDVEEIGGVMRGRFGADDDEDDEENNAELQELLKTLRKRRSSASASPAPGDEGKKKKRRARVEVETEGEMAPASTQHNNNV